MDKMLLSIVVAGSLFAAGCTQQSEKAATSEPAAAVESQAQGLAQQATEATQQVAEAVAPVKEEVQNVANAAVDQAKDLLAKAQEMIANGKFEEAVAMAQKVLSIDPNNIDAKNIIETAKAKITEIAQQKAGDLKNDVTNKLNALGN